MTACRVVRRLLGAPITAEAFALEFQDESVALGDDGEDPAPGLKRPIAARASASICGGR